MTYFLSAGIIGIYFIHDFMAALIGGIPCILIGIFISAGADGYLSSRYPGFLYTPYEDKAKLVIERKERRDVEQAKVLNIIENELLYPYTSLSWKYKLIGDFCFEHPNLINRLKKSEKYIIWRTDVIDWAKSNSYRLESFYFNDGVVNYVFDSDFQTDGLIDLIDKYKYQQDVGYEVICNVDFKSKHLPEDYFEYPGLVWESEDIDYDEYFVNKKRTTVAEALSFGVGLGAGLELAGDNGSNIYGGNDAGGCDGLC